MHLCEECSQKLGISKMEFKMPIDFSSFFGDFLEEFENTSFMPELSPIKELKCDNCNLTFEEFMNTGKFGCGNCYDAFQNKIDPILKNIQGSNRHVGRLGKIEGRSILNEMEKDSINKKEKQSAGGKNAEIEASKQVSKIESLKEQLKQAIKEEKYEEAARLRDEIKELEG